MKMTNEDVKPVTEWTKLLVEERCSEKNVFTQVNENNNDIHMFRPDHNNMMLQQNEQRQTQQQRHGDMNVTTTNNHITTTSYAFPVPLYILYLLDGVVLSLPSLAYMYIVNEHVNMPTVLLPSYAALSFLPYSLKPFFAILSNQILATFLKSTIERTETSATNRFVSNTNSHRPNTDHTFTSQNDINQQSTKGNGNHTTSIKLFVQKRDWLLVILLVFSSICTVLGCAIPKSTSSASLLRNKTGNRSGYSIVWCYIWGIFKGILTAWTEYIYQWILIDEAVLLFRKSNDDSCVDKQIGSIIKTDKRITSASASTIPDDFGIQTSMSPTSTGTSSNIPKTSSPFSGIASIYQSQSSTAKNIGSFVASAVLFVIFLAASVSSSFISTNNKTTSTNAKTAWSLLFATSFIQLLSAGIVFWYQIGRTASATEANSVPSRDDHNDDSPDTSDAMTRTNMMTTKQKQTKFYRVAVRLVVVVQLCLLLLLLRQPVSFGIVVSNHVSAWLQWIWSTLFSILICYGLYLLSLVKNNSSNNINDTDRHNHMLNEYSVPTAFGIGIFLIVQNSMPDVSYLFSSFIYDTMQLQFNVVSKNTNNDSDMNFSNTTFVHTATTQRQGSPFIFLLIMQLFTIWDSFIMTVACWLYGQITSRYCTRSPQPQQVEESEANVAIATGVPTTNNHHQEKRCDTDDNTVKEQDYTNLKHIIIGTTILASLASLLNIITVHVLQRNDNKKIHPRPLLSPWINSSRTSSSNSGSTIDSASTSTSTSIIINVLVVLCINSIVTLTSEWKFIPEIVLATIASVDDDNDCKNLNNSPNDIDNTATRGSNSGLLSGDNTSSNSTDSYCHFSGNDVDETSVDPLLVPLVIPVRNSGSEVVATSFCTNDNDNTNNISCSPMCRNNNTTSGTIGTKYSSLLSCIDFGDQISSILTGILVSYHGTAKDNHWNHLSTLILLCSLSSLVIPPLLLWNIIPTKKVKQ